MIKATKEEEQTKKQVEEKQCSKTVGTEKKKYTKAAAREALSRPSREVVMRETGHQGGWRGVNPVANAQPPFHKLGGGISSTVGFSADPSPPRPSVAAEASTSTEEV